MVFHPRALPANTDYILLEFYSRLWAQCLGVTGKLPFLEEISQKFMTAQAKTVLWSPFREQGFHPRPVKLINCYWDFFLKKGYTTAAIAPSVSPSTVH